MCSPKIGIYLFLILKLFKFQTRRFVCVTQGLVPCHNLKGFNLFYLFYWEIILNMTYYLPKDYLCIYSY